MSRTRQPLPNRRFRRLLPAALVTATVAAGLPLGGPPPARADTPRRAQSAPPPIHKAVVPRAPLRGGADAQRIGGP